MNEEPNLEQNEKELSLEEKKLLAEVWTNIIVSDQQIPANLEKLDNSGIKKWLFDSLMKDVEKFIKELGIEIGADLIETIKQAKTPEEKSRVELDYVKKINEIMHKITNGFVMSPDKTTKWDSWPKKMRETKQFNCVGASLLGTFLLKKLINEKEKDDKKEEDGFQCFYGSPTGHALNIIKLSDGRWIYTDFRNGSHNLTEIKPEEITVEGVRCLKINDPKIDYKLIPIWDPSEACASILGNLDTLIKDARNYEQTKTIEDKEAMEFFTKNKKILESLDFSKIQKLLYPKVGKLDESPEMRNEEKRVKELRNIDEPIQNYLNTLTAEQKDEMLEEISSHKKEIENFFLNNDFSIFNKINQNLKKLLEIQLEILKSLKKKSPELYEENLNKITGKIRAL